MSEESEGMNLRRRKYMKVRELVEKLTEISEAREIVMGRIDAYGKEFSGQEPLYNVIKVLDDFREWVLSTEITV